MDLRRLLHIAIALILLNIVYGCSVEVFNTNVLGCTYGGRQYNLETDNNFVPNTTECVIVDTTETRVATCVDDQWRYDVEPIQKEIRHRKKRFFLGRFIRGVGHFISSLAKGATCILTLFNSCGRSGPPPDREPPNLSCPEPYVTFNAEPFQTHGKAYWKEPDFAKDERDGLIKPRRYTCCAPGRQFSEGKTYVVYGAKDNSGNEKTCTVTVDIKVIRCTPPVQKDNAYFTCHPSTDFVLGGWCHYGCYDGFELDGPGQLTCQKNGQWTNPQPICKPFKCSELPDIEGATLRCTNGNYFRSICTYSCGVGYDMPPRVSKTLVCTLSKTWRSYGQPQCIDVEPPSLHSCPSIVLAGTDTGVNSTTISWKPPQVTDNSGMTIIAKQKDGPLLGTKVTAGRYKVTYEAEDMEQNKARECSFNVIVRDIRCPRLYPTPFVQISCPNGYRTGVQCKVTCDPGKTRNGTENVSCNSKGLYGEWNWGSRQQTTCSSSHSCLTLKPPINGAIACDNWLGGEFCQVQCQNGTSMAGVDWRKLHACSSSGEWIPKPNIRPCRVTRHPGSVISAYLSYYYYGDCSEEYTKETIRDNFVNIIKFSLYQKEACSDSIECRSENVQVKCGAVSRHRRESSNTTDQSPTFMLLTIDLQLPLKVSPNESFASTTKNGWTLFEKMKDLAIKSKIDFGNASVDTVHMSGGSIDVICPTGSVKTGRTLQCVDCPEGTYFHSGTDTCESCDKGTYQDEGGQLKCKQCPDKTNTRSTGAMSYKECEDTCLPGTFSNDGIVPCSPCEVGYYQTSYGQQSCHKCRGAKSTLTVQFDKSSDCQEFDIQLPKGKVKSATKTLQKVTLLKDFTLSFWMRSWQISKLIEFSIVLRDNNGTELFLLKDVNSACFNNGNKTLLNTSASNNRWHIFTYEIKNCTITAKLDNILVTTNKLITNCKALAVSSIEIKSGADFEGSISQLNIWKSMEKVPFNSRCFVPATGDILSWQDFGEAELTNSYIHLPSLCDDFDNCVSSPCLHGSCTDIQHGYECSCMEGYGGVQCDNNIDDCKANICINNSTCVDGVLVYTCQCPDLYTGQFCEVEQVNGQWSAWGNWSDCTTTCDEGQRSRTRLCNDPTPDNGGNNCTGDDLQLISCNKTQCPTCEDITAPVNGSFDCETSDDAINCTVTCDNGFDFDIEPLPLYFCGPSTYHEWNFQTKTNPERRLPKCTPIILPETLKVHYTALYKDLYCSTIEIKEETIHNINVQVEIILKTVGCFDSPYCSLESVHILNCDVAKRRRRAVERAGFTLTVKSQPDKESGNASLSYLQDAFTNIHEAADNGDFTVEVLDDEYELDTNSTTLHGDITCGLGQTRINFYCVRCGQGSFQHEDYCKSCDFGTYQDKEGQPFCNPCPKGTSTIGHGSTAIDDCSVSVTITEETGIKVVSVVLGCLASIVAVIISVFAYRRYRASVQKRLDITDISNIPMRESPQNIDVNQDVWNTRQNQKRLHHYFPKHLLNRTN